MHHFSYQNGTLHAEEVSLIDIARDVGTPFYCYSTATLTRHYDVLAQAFKDLAPLICFGVKANSNQAVLKTLAQLGAGMDVVSAGELHRARAAGVPANKIIFAGVGKTRDEMAYALSEGIHSFNVESEPELTALSDVAAALGHVATAALRINPDIDAKTHKKITTGTSENKFGIAYDDAARIFELARKLPALKLTGLHMHIGSQITDLDPFCAAFKKLRALAEDLIASGYKLNHIDIGGGLGVPYRGLKDLPPHPDEYADVVRETLGGLNLEFALEPGRMIAGNAGVLVTRVVYVKEGKDKTFTIVDAAMNDLLRPTLYDAFHDIWPVAEEEDEMPPIVQDIVGPVCETGDFLAQDRRLPPFAAGDLMAVMTAGAYSAVMSSTYNTRALIPEIMVNGKDYAVVRPRLSPEDLIALDRLPPWLETR